MKAAQFYTAGDIRIDEVAAPSTALAPTEVLVRNRMCGICGTDLHEYSHGPLQTSAQPHPRTGGGLPQILGHEYAGEVVAVGPHVRVIKQGDQVLFNPEDRYEVEVQGEDYVILRERDIHAVASERVTDGTGLYL